jgi:FAD/FMN-containing dehydrogenase
MSDFGELSIDGRVATPSDPDWDEARQAWNLAADQRPDAVAFVEGADDVATVVRFAADRGLKVAPQGTGHGALPLAPLEGTILIKTERMRGVEVDPGARTARIEAGVLSAELASAAGEHGLSFLPGSSPDTGVIGYTLGGGLGWLGRRYGFACNRVAGIELVTADGETRWVDADSEPDLFWALRGGGGSHAIVTTLHLDLVELGEVYAGLLVFPADLGAAGVRAYRDWAEDLPEEVTATMRLLRPPPVPDVPEPIRDRPLLVIGAGCIGGQADGERLMAPMRKLGEPIMDTFAQVPASQLGRVAMDPEQPVPAVGHHRVIRELPDEAIDAFLGAAGPEAGSPLTVAELRHLGGALARADENAGALAKLDADFVMTGVGVAMTPEMGEASEHNLDTLHAAMEPWAGAGGYLNFADRPSDLDEILPADVCDRLREIKRRWDPDGTIMGNHELSLAPV